MQSILQTNYEGHDKKSNNTANRLATNNNSSKYLPGTNLPQSGSIVDTFCLAVFWQFNLIFD